MEIYPAIDLMDGKVVRLQKGDPSLTTTYTQLGSPLDIALKWEDQGADRIHIVDLDAALQFGDNWAIVRKLTEHLTIPIQLGGGIREKNIASHILESGIDRIIIGTLAVQNPDYLLQIGDEFGFNRLVVSIDYKSNKVAIDGWQRCHQISPSEFLNSLRKEGLCHFLMTSIENDGLLQGPDNQLATICGNTRDDIIVAGGISNLDDTKILKAKGFGAAVIGKALYEGSISLQEAISIGRGLL